MKKRIIEGIEVEAGSGNVFADLGLPDAEKLKVKSGLVVEIVNAIRRLDLTQDEAAQRMGLTQLKVSALLRGDFTNLSERKLMDCLNRIGQVSATSLRLQSTAARGRQSAPPRRRRK